MALFKRGARLTLYPTPRGALFAHGGTVDAVVIEGLRITFKVERTTSKEPNTCEITVTNAAPATRALMHRKPLTAILEAGYDGNLQQLFRGDVIYAPSKIDGTEWITTLQVADGGRAHTNARIAKSFRAGTTAIKVLEDLAAQLQLLLPAELAKDPALKKPFASGVSAQGHVHRELTRILSPFGYAWSVQNGSLQILRTDGTRAGEALVVDESNGMLGSPEQASPEKGKAAASVFARMLLYPTMIPGSKVALKSRQHTGNFRAERVTHNGDTHGAEYITEVELKPL